MTISHRAPTDQDVIKEVKDLRADLLALDSGVQKTVRIPLVDLRKDGAIKDQVDDAAGSSLCGLADTVGAALLGNPSNNNSKTDFVAYQLVLPQDYVPGSNITFRIRAKKDTTLATVSDTVDLIAKLVGDAAVGSDICATAAQQITVAYANYDFTITGTGLVAGDVLDLRISLNSNDTGGAVNKGVICTAMWFLYTGYGALNTHSS